MPTKHSYKYIKSEFEKEGYVLVNEHYLNAHVKLNYICPNGHSHKISWNNWKAGNRCSYCCKYQNKYSIGDIRNEFEKEKYKLLSNNYYGAHSKLDYICPRGHKNSINWTNWQQGKRCPYCAGLVKKNINFISKEFEKEGYKLLTKKYKNAYQKLNYICPKGHTHKISWHKWQLGRRCPFCSNNVSIWEKEVKKFITNLNIDYIPNDRRQLINPETNRPLELDIWMPQLNKAIECNGVYWHDNEKRKSVDKIKQQLCVQLKIDLLVLIDQEWYNDRNECKKKIRKFIDCEVD